MKICRHCGGPKPCKPCTRQRQQAWADAKRERVREQKKAYEARFPERVLASKRKYYEAHKQEMKDRTQARRTANPEAERARNRQQYAKDPTPFRQRAQRREERDRLVGGTFTDLDKCALFQIQRGLCANPYCEADLAETGFHADHKIPVMRGGSHDPVNRQLLCPTCNHRKCALSNEEWLQLQAKQERQA
jgi:HNH endonuclease